MSLFDEFTCPSKHSFYHVGIFFLLIMIFILGMIERVSEDFFYHSEENELWQGLLDGRSSYHMCSMSLVLIMNIPFFIEYIVYISIGLVRLPYQPYYRFDGIIVV